MERLRAKKAQHSKTVFGFAWYTEEQWVHVKVSAVDPERFETTYSEWVDMAESTFENLRRAIGNPIKVNVDANELAAWCLVHGKRNNASARAEFVSYKLENNGR